MDGPRFVASLQTEKDPVCYKDFFETEKLAEAKKKADEQGEKHNRAVMVFDRRLHFVVYEYKPEKPKEVIPVTPVRNTRARKVKRK